MFDERPKLNKLLSGNEDSSSQAYLESLLESEIIPQVSLAIHNKDRSFDSSLEM